MQGAGKLGSQAEQMGKNEDSYFSTVNRGMPSEDAEGIDVEPGASWDARRGPSKHTTSARGLAINPARDTSPWNQSKAGLI